jgi:hypothetical protein
VANREHLALFVYQKQPILACAILQANRRVPIGSTGGFTRFQGVLCAIVPDKSSKSGSNQPCVFDHLDEALRQFDSVGEFDFHAEKRRNLRSE